jgi:hypothetical protein
LTKTTASVDVAGFGIVQKRKLSAPRVAGVSADTPVPVTSIKIHTVADAIERV